MRVCVGYEAVTEQLERFWSPTPIMGVRFFYKYPGKEGYRPFNRHFAKEIYYEKGEKYVAKCGYGYSASEHEGEWPETLRHVSTNDGFNHSRCFQGFYAFDFESMKLHVLHSMTMGDEKPFLAVVALSGTVLQHERGYTAQQMVIVEIEPIPYFRMWYKWPIGYFLDKKITKWYYRTIVEWKERYG